MCGFALSINPQPRVLNAPFKVAAFICLFAKCPCPELVFVLLGFIQTAEMRGRVVVKKKKPLWLHGPVALLPLPTSLCY